MRRHRVARAIVHRLLRLVRGGVLELRERDRPPVRFGALDPAQPLGAVLEVHSPAFYPALLRGSVGFAEAHMDGLWSSPDLVALVRLGARNGEALDRPRRWRAPAHRPGPRAGGRARNTIHRSRRQIAAHYDLGNDLFALFLDERMMYSSAVFPHRGRHAGGGGAAQARAGVPQARPRPRRPPARDRHGLGRAAPCTPPRTTAAG